MKKDITKIWIECPAPHSQGRRFFMYPKSMISDLTVNDVTYCVFHAELYKDREKAPKTEKAFDKEITKIRNAISGSYTIE